ncbi:MAG: hypothetical protein V1809_08925 [Planctomycetota bacterium]
MMEPLKLAAWIAVGFLVYVMVYRAVRHSAFLAETPVRGKLIAVCVTILGLMGMKRCMDLVLIPYGALAIALALLWLFLAFQRTARGESDRGHPDRTNKAKRQKICEMPREDT